MEADAANKAFTMRRKAEELRKEREAAIAAEVEELERQATAAAAPGASHASPAAAPAASASTPAPAPKPVAAAPGATSLTGQKAGTSAGLTAGPQQLVDRSQEAVILKDKGRDLFNRGDVGAAVSAWRQALELCALGGEAMTSDSIAVACHANLALALVKLGDPAGALAHADAVLQVRKKQYRYRSGFCGECTISCTAGTICPILSTPAP
jgi:hypothetical protein